MKKLVITDWNTLSMTDDLSTAALQELADVTAYPLTAQKKLLLALAMQNCCSATKPPSPQPCWMPAQT